MTVSAAQLFPGELRLDEEGACDDYRLADDMFREAVQANLAEEDNLESIRAAFEQRVNDAFERGEFIVEVKRLTVDHMWSRVNGRAGMNTLAVVKEIASGQIGIDLDAWLDQVVTVGTRRRSTVRDLGKGDWDRIVAVRQENADRAAEALEMTKRAARISVPSWVAKWCPAHMWGPRAKGTYA